MLTSIFSKLVLESGAIVQNLTKWTTCVENPVIYDGAQTIKQIYIPLRADPQQPQGGGKGMPTFSTVTEPWYINKFPNIPNNREFDITIKSRILGTRVQLRAVFLALDPSQTLPPPSPCSLNVTQAKGRNLNRGSGCPQSTVRTNTSNWIRTCDTSWLRSLRRRGNQAL